VGGLGVAITVPATRRSLRRRWLIALALAMTAAGLLALAGWKANAHARASALQHDGVRTDATIVAVLATPVGRGRVPDGSVRIRFDAANQSLESSVYVGGAVVDYRPEQEVQVVYDPSDPRRVELLGVTTFGPGVPVVPPLAAGVLLAAMALVAGKHARQIGRVVRKEQWQPVKSQLVQVPQSFGFRQGSRTLLVLETPGGAVTVEPVGLSRVDPTFSPEAWVAGLDAAPMVLAAPGGSHLVPVRRR
jgi:hypothetical protein